MGDEAHEPEIIQSDNVIVRGSIGNVETHGDIIKIKAAVWIVGLTLAVGCITLWLSVIYIKPELQTWATGIISAVSGAAISYGFNSRKGA